jgi:putative transposase
MLRDERLIEGVLAILREVSSLQSFLIHAYCFMPDHLHLLCEGMTHESRLLDFLSRFKQRTAFAQRQNGGGTLWQGRSFDRVLRREDAMEDVAWYIWMNPVRKGFCSDPKQFPFSGSLTMAWREKKSPDNRWTPPWRKSDAGLKPGATKPLPTDTVERSGSLQTTT